MLTTMIVLDLGRSPEANAIAAAAMAVPHSKPMFMPSSFAQLRACSAAAPGSMAKAPPPLIA